MLALVSVMTVYFKKGKEKALQREQLGAAWAVLCWLPTVAIANHHVLG